MKPGDRIEVYEVLATGKFHIGNQRDNFTCWVWTHPYCHSTPNSELHPIGALIIKTVK